MKIIAFVLIVILGLAWAGPRCPKVCKKDYSPVCAMRKDGAQCTFSNLCTMQMNGCRSKNAWVRHTKGPCKKNSAMCKKL